MAALSFSPNPPLLGVSIALYRQEVVGRYFSVALLAQNSLLHIFKMATRIKECRKLPFFPESIILSFKQQAVAPRAQIMTDLAVANLLLSKLNPDESLENQVVYMHAHVAHELLALLRIQITSLENTVQSL